MLCIGALGEPVRRLYRPPCRDWASYRPEDRTEIDFDPALTLAALRLAPENASATVRLEMLRRHPEALAPFLAGEDWANAAADALFPALRDQEDAPPHPFTERVVGPAGAATVLAGPVQDSVFVLRMLIRAFLLDARTLPRLDHQRLAKRVSAVLGTADSVTTRARLPAFSRPFATRRIFRPDEKTFARYAAAVSWTPTELRTIPGSTRALAAMCSAPYSSVERRIDGWLIAAPELIVAELNELLIAQFTERWGRDELDERYDRAIWSTVAESMARLGARAGEMVAENGRRASFQMTDDHAAHVLLMPRTLLRLADPDRRVADTDLEMAEMQAGAAVNDVVLAVGQPIVDPYFDNAGHEAGPFRLSVSAADLDILSRLSDSTSLTLLRFARSAARARARADVHRFSTLDEYQLYLMLGERHPHGSPRRPINVLAGPGAALPLRLRAARDTGLESAQLPGGGIVEVVRRFRADIAVYLPPAAFPGVASVLKLPGTDVWFVCPRVSANELLESIVDSLSTFGALAVRARPDAFAKLPPSVTVYVSMQPFDDMQLRHEANDAVLLLQAAPPTTVRIAVDPAFQSLAERPDNDADRALLSVLLTGICLLRGTDPQGLASLVDKVAPRGRKRLLMALDGGHTPAVGRADVPEWRPISDAEVEVWRDELGLQLLRSGYRSRAVKRRMARQRLLNRAVRHLFERLTAEVRRLDAGNSIRRLIERIEATYRAETLLRLRLVGGAEIFGEDAAEVTQMRVDLFEIARAATATRFLLEYITAQPPVGAEPLGEARGDELCALAAAIVELGMASDAVSLGLFSGDISITPSGAVKVTGASPARARFIIATDRWRRGVTAAVYDDHWPAAETSSDSEADDLAAAETAWSAEFGISLTATATFLHAAVLYADSVESSVVDKSRETLVAELAARLGWTVAKSDRVLATMTLEPRADFLEPPRYRVYPWRFNRELSYIRRPFIERSRGGERRIVFGTRQLYVSARTLVELVTSGRLSARTEPMRQLMGDLAHSRAEAFVEIVARTCRDARLRVRTGLRKVGRTRVGGRGRDLGDLDVLAADLARRRLWAIECKAIYTARTPWEEAQELKDFRGRGGYVARHARRVSWVRRNLRSVLTELGLEHGTWNVVGLIVTDMPAPTAYYGSSRGIRTVYITELAEELSK